MTIGEIAKTVGVATSTLRYYERAGLLAAPARSAARYRVYDEASLQRLRFIRAAQAVGFTLDDIRLLLSLNSDASCRDVQAQREAVWVAGPEAAVQISVLITHRTGL